MAGEGSHSSPVNVVKDEEAKEMFQIKGAKETGQLNVRSTRARSG